jgi:pimeloyl-ACP methyl ester carboxylesterase
MYLALLGVLTLFLFKSAHSSPCDDVYPQELDVGIYWATSFALTPTGIRSGLQKSCTYMREVNISSFYNPGKPSMIFVHGAQPDLVKRGYDRTGFGPDWAKISSIWLSRGWNVGFFQWGQFSDEPIRNFERAQAKIWNTRYFAGMDYTYRPAGTPEGTVKVGEASIKYDVAQILVDAIVKHEFQSHLELRLIGHSLGTQLAMRAAYLLRDNIHMVDRVTLLDPVFSSLPQGFLFTAPEGMIISDVLGQYAKELANRGVATDVHAASKINACLKSSSSNALLMKHTAYVRWIFNEWGEQDDVSCFGEQLWGDPAHLKENASDMALQVANQHAAVVPAYFLSLAYPPMRCHIDKRTGICIHEDSLSVSAAMPSAQVLVWQNITNKDGDKICLKQFDDGDRSPSGITMSVLNARITPVHFMIVSCTTVHT